MKISKRRASGGFSIVELMTAMVILSVLMLMMTVMLEQVQKSWRFSESRISQFREARVAFDLITKNMSQATSNTYFDYKYDTKTNTVEDFTKRSELHFYVDHGKSIASKLGLNNVNGHAVFFQAPLGYSVQYRNLGNLFNGRGYLVVHGSDNHFRPSFVTADRFRFRLMEFRPPAEANQVFQDAVDEIESGREQEFSSWWNQGLKSIGSGDFVDYLNPLAENIVLLVVAPVDSIDTAGASRYELGASAIAPNYQFDSNVNEKANKQVPPMVRVTMVAIDEETAVRLAEDSGRGMPDILSGEKLFKNMNSYNSDIESFVDMLNRESRDGRPINYRVFSTTIMMRASKWLG